MRRGPADTQVLGPRAHAVAISAGAFRQGGAAVWSFCRKKPLGGVSAFIILLLVTCAIFADLIVRNDPFRIFPGQSFVSPGTTVPGGGVMLLGGDNIGRDLFSRLIFGSRISLGVGLLAVLFGLTVGTTLGLTSAYFGGKLDLIAQRFVDGMMAFPFLVLALLLVTLMGTGATFGGISINLILVIGIALIPVSSRVVRATTLSVKENVYIEAARAVGASHGRILVRHILPNVAHAIIIVGATYLGAAILIEASLSFLGYGSPPPSPSWGQMIAGPGRSALETYPRLLWAPAVAISLVVLAFNLLGDALRDVWDPRLRGTR